MSTAEAKGTTKNEKINSNVTNVVNFDFLVIKVSLVFIIASFCLK